jgi:hypothetical protein
MILVATNRLQLSCYAYLLLVLLVGNIRRRVQILLKDVVRQTYVAPFCKLMPELLQCCLSSVGLGNEHRVVGVSTAFKSKHVALFELACTGCGVF